MFVFSLRLPRHALCSWKTLPLGYNYLTKPANRDAKYTRQHIALGGQAHILHFAGDRKPWGSQHVGQVYYRDPWRTFHDWWHQACGAGGAAGRLAQQRKFVSK